MKICSAYFFSGSKQRSRHTALPRLRTVRSLLENSHFCKVLRNLSTCWSRRRGCGCVSAKVCSAKLEKQSGLCFWFLLGFSCKQFSFLGFFWVGVLLQHQHFPLHCSLVVHFPKTLRNMVFGQPVCQAKWNLMSVFESKHHHWTMSSVHAAATGRRFPVRHN